MTRARLNVRSYDADGSMFPTTYTDHLATNEIKINDGRQALKELLIQFNPEPIAKIQRDIAENNIDEVILMVGSNRQCFMDDRANSNARNSGSFYPALEAMRDVFNEAIGRPICRVDRYLLSDTYGKKKHGYNFTAALNDASLDPEDKANKYDSWLFDKSKLTLLYAQMHKMASEHPDREIIFDFFDDDDKILKPLHEFFQREHHLIPENMRSRLHFYAGDKIISKDPIQGTGDIDYNYERSIRLMLKIADIKEDAHGEHHLLQKLKENHGILQFLNTRNTHLEHQPRKASVNKIIEVKPIAPASKHVPFFKRPNVRMAGLGLLVGLGLMAFLIGLSLGPFAPIYILATAIGLLCKLTGVGAAIFGFIVLGVGVLLASSGSFVGIRSFWRRNFTSMRGMKEVAINDVELLPVEKPKLVDIAKPKEGEVLNAAAGLVMSGSTSAITHTLINLSTTEAGQQPERNDLELEPRLVETDAAEEAVVSLEGNELPDQALSAEATSSDSDGKKKKTLLSRFKDNEEKNGEKRKGMSSRKFSHNTDKDSASHEEGSKEGKDKRKGPGLRKRTLNLFKTEKDGENKEGDDTRKVMSGRSLSHDTRPKKGKASNDQTESKYSTLR